MRNDIRDACSRIEGASSLFHFKLRTVRDDFDELAANWADTRAQRFQGVHLQPQNEIMHAGIALWRDVAESAQTADQSAEQVEYSLRQAYAFETDARQEIQITDRLLRAAEELSAHAASEALRVMDQTEALAAAIVAAAHDPGW